MRVLFFKDASSVIDEVMTMCRENIYRRELRLLFLVVCLIMAPTVLGCKGDKVEPAPQEDAGGDAFDIGGGDGEGDSGEEPGGDVVEDVEDVDDVEDVEDVEDVDDVGDEDPRFDCDEGEEPFGGGDGSAADPYQLCAPAHLEAIGAGGERLNQHYVLVQTIDLSAVEGFEGIGSSDAPFRGQFDGNKRAIKNMKIDRPGVNYVGLFGALGSDGEVFELTLESVDVQGRDFVGGVAGINQGGEVRGCAVNGRVVGKDMVGGVVGQNEEGIVRDSFSLSVVEGENSVGGLVGMNDEGQILSSYSAGKVEGERNVGGLVGLNFDGGVQNSYSTAEIAGGEQLGGLVGASSGMITNSYSAGRVQGNAMVGGLVGMELDGQATNLYWDKDTSGVATSAQGMGLTTAEFADPASFGGWSVGSIWKMGVAPDGVERPILSWQD